MFPSLVKLTRLGVSLAVSFSAATAFLVKNGNVNSHLLCTILGVFLLAGGASALNQFQEKEIDTLMQRTKNRPIPSNKISAKAGLLIALILCICGFLVLYVKTGFTPALLGLLNIIWYNGFYTYLKRKTAFAVVLGSLTGVMPLLIGWSAAGGYLLSPTIVIISFFIYMWQIPHFWILLIKYNDDYKKAGLGNLYALFSPQQAKHLIFVWIFATSLSSLFLPLFGIIHNIALVLGLILVNIWIIVSFYFIIFSKKDFLNYTKATVSINAFMLIVLTMLIADAMIK